MKRTNGFLAAGYEVNHGALVLVLVHVKKTITRVLFPV